MNQQAGLQEVLDRIAIQDVVNGIDNATDAKDWALARSYFADRIIVDFGALSGAGPQQMAADDLIAAWTENLFPAKLTFHLAGNHQITVDGDRAVCVSKGYALNVLTTKQEDNIWEVWATYTHRLERTPDGWLCTEMALDVVTTRGDDAVRTAGPDA
ncbi:nuclear transport factor 2 family protein [Microlunatus soli]|uniref:SnoaL-like domain-containing protein n=1 Tax=Microlunatus soli TaxID=630515 RepID=A0A1H1X922_9ACTN|nr:nuclear transport factor 2 family protein [Microlunatus soli]SDT05702.1 SnoaL-like domain-containing protein [Microlunatus soli]